MIAESLRSKYGGASVKLRTAINRAIRAECPGGAHALDRLADWSRICNRLGWGDPQTHGTGAEPLHVTTYRHLLEIVDAMEDDVRVRYEMPRKTQREDLRR